MHEWLRDGTNTLASCTLVDESLFNEILARERRRSDRSNQSFLLLCLGPRAPIARDWHGALGKILEALATTRRGTDIAGWLEDQATIGVILPGIDSAHLPATCKGLEARLRRELAIRVDPEMLEKLSIEFHAYPEPRHAGQRGHWAIDPILYPDLRAPRRRHPVADGLKRTLDVAISLGLLVALSPIFLVIATLVKLGTRGPVLFRQVRIGYLAEPFTMLKFRSMYTGADDKVHQDYISSFIHGHTNGTSASNPQRDGLFKLANDRRITPIGHLLRKTSLDELPQLWNVLRGDMSLVGPRPPLPYELEQYASWHRCRVVEAMPGITGLWQVKGRSRTTFDEMVRLDLQYVRTRSLWTDIKILAATPRAVLSGKGAC
jgi:lipopolysaccharide/colanic/teichoic acid biosynthesis glycosyltransferase